MATIDTRYGRRKGGNPQFLWRHRNRIKLDQSSEEVAGNLQQVYASVSSAFWPWRAINLCGAPPSHSRSISILSQPSGSDTGYLIQPGAVARMPVKPNMAVCNSEPKLVRKQA